MHVFLVKVVNRSIYKYCENSFYCVKLDHALYSINYGRYNYTCRCTQTSYTCLLSPLSLRTSECWSHLGSFISPSVEHHGDESHVAMATELPQFVVHHTVQHRPKISGVTSD